MSNYEFWDELGKIFSAVVAYQEKSVEFNKRFIHPWIRLGNVFDQDDRNKEAVHAFQKAIELDPANAQNWYELGNVHFRMKSYDEAAEAYQKAIDLDPDSGWAYSNLALTFATQGKHIESVPLYQKSIELIAETRDRAVAWNRLGNVYRKLNEYELALQAFQNADELDAENAGFRDELDEVSEGPTLVEGGPAPAIDGQTMLPPESLQQLVAASLKDAPASEPSAPRSDVQSEAAPIETAALVPDEPGAEIAAALDLGPEFEIAPEAMAESLAEDAAPEAPAPEPAPAWVDEAVGSAANDTDESEGTYRLEDTQPMASLRAKAAAASEPTTVAAPAEVVPAEEETITAAAPEAVVTFTEPVIVVESIVKVVEPQLPFAEQAPSASPEQDVAAVDPAQSFDQIVVSDDPEEAEPAAGAASPPEVPNEAQAAAEAPAAETPRPAAEPLVPEHAAYDEFLKDSQGTFEQPGDVTGADASEEESAAASQEPVAKINASGDVQIEMDARNAHVWNELGNVYFNTGAFDDAVAAYTKAIELDRWFAWPYSNLALAYMQKGRFAEAILLYQRSIELFTNDKDKAISWNRLGNVYRRLNDYDNAIASYQRADELDPENTALSLQSRFSLLGTFSVENKPSYAA